MPRHLIRDAHEWINEILTVPIYALANPQSRERAWQRRRGKKTLLSLTLVWFEKWFWRCRISGSFRAALKYHYFEHCFSQCMKKCWFTIGIGIENSWCVVFLELKCWQKCPSNKSVLGGKRGEKFPFFSKSVCVWFCLRKFAFWWLGYTWRVCCE